MRGLVCLLGLVCLVGPVSEVSPRLREPQRNFAFFLSLKFWYFQGSFFTRSTGNFC